MKNIFKQTLALLAISLSANSVPAQDQNTNDQQMPPAVESNMPITAQHFVWEAATIDMKEIQTGELALQKSENPDVKAFAEHMISNHKRACKKLKAIADNEGLKFPDTNSVDMMNRDGHWNGSSNWSSNREETIDTNAYLTLPQTRGEHALTNTESSLANDDTMNTNSGSITNTYTMAVVPRGQDSVTNPIVNDSATATNGNTYVHADLPRGQHLATNMDNEVNSGIQQPEVQLDMLSGAEFDRAYAKKMVKGHEQAIRKFEMAAANLQDADLKKYADKMLPTLRTHLRMAEELQNKVGMESGTGMTNSDN